MYRPNFKHSNFPPFAQLNFFYPCYTYLLYHTMTVNLKKKKYQKLPIPFVNMLLKKRTFIPPASA